MSLLVGVPTEAVPSIWHEIEPLVVRALEKTKDHRWGPADVLVGLQDRDMQLWISMDEDGLAAMLITRLVNYPRCRECELFMWAGHKTPDSLKQLEVIEEWARAQGCQYMATLSRRGSAKFVGYEQGLIQTYRGL